MHTLEFLQWASRAREIKSTFLPVKVKPVIAWLLKTKSEYYINHPINQPTRRGQFQIFQFFQCITEDSAQEMYTLCILNKTDSIIG